MRKNADVRCQMRQGLISIWEGIFECPSKIFENIQFDPERSFAAIPEDQK